MVPLRPLLPPTGTPLLPSEWAVSPWGIPSLEAVVNKKLVDLYLHGVGINNKDFIVNSYIRSLRSRYGTFGAHPFI